LLAVPHFNYVRRGEGHEVAFMVHDADITGLLTALRNGDRGAMDRLLPLVYDDLRERAHRQLSRRRSGDTLSTTALVHEAYLKLAGSAQQSYEDRIHFFAVASRAMRQILVDYARRGAAGKRNGGRVITLDPEAVPSLDRTDELLALDEALGELERADERLARMVELRFFGGLSVEETSEIQGISPRTVKRDWRKARAFLYHAMRGDAATENDGPFQE
jgi:RNA polymerase sigma factor (TIGR02999 family)